MRAPVIVREPGVVVEPLLAVGGEVALLALVPRRVARLPVLRQLALTAAGEAAQVAHRRLVPLRRRRRLLSPGAKFRRKILA